MLLIWMRSSDRGWGLAWEGRYAVGAGPADGGMLRWASFFFFSRGYGKVFIVIGCSDYGPIIIRGVLLCLWAGIALGPVLLPA